MRTRPLVIALFLAHGPVVLAQATVQSPPISVSDVIAARFLAAAESAAVAPRDRAIWQQRFDAARDTLEAVLAWYNDHNRGEQSLRLLMGAGRFWSGPVLVSRYEQALALPSAQDQTSIRALALNLASAAAFRIKDQDRTRRWAIESIATWRRLSNLAGMGRGYERLVQVALREGDHGALRALADTGDAFCVRAGDEDCHAYFLNMRGESARVLAQYDSSATYYDKAATIYGRISPTFRLDIAHNVGFVLLDLGRTSSARARFAEGLRHAVASANRSFWAFFLAGFASAAAAEGEATTAARLFGASDALLEQLGITADPADAVEYERYRSRARTQLGATAFDAEVQVGRKLPVDSLIAAQK
ncbi:MAG: hypothetical protein NVS1B5_04180 [Gemmatimonadaceae bacterium]